MAPWKRWILVVSSLSMMALGLYLTQHYFQVHFPTADEPHGLCNLSSFWNCDQTALSPIGAIFGIPLGVFGAVTGLLFLIAAAFPSFFLASTRSLALVNALGCLALGAYSILALGGLCPACSLYYLASFLALFAVGYQSMILPPLLPVFSQGSLGIAVIALFFLWTPAGQNTLTEVTPKAEKLFEKAPLVGDPSQESGFWLHQSTEKFKDAPIRISIFSDFQCPACRALRDFLPAAIKPFKHLVNAQFFFYPMDDSCNYQIPVGYGPHPQACQASRIAACAGDRFEEIHNEIFDHQDQISPTYLDSLASQYNIQNCYRSKESRSAIKDHLAVSQHYNVRGTPLLIINGKEVGGFLPTPYLVAIFHKISGQDTAAHK
ncbi:MAG: vitamin K epoxide reductase family protein [Oligoflexales bacterium]